MMVEFDIRTLIYNLSKLGVLKTDSLIKQDSTPNTELSLMTVEKRALGA